MHLVKALTVAAWVCVGVCVGMCVGVSGYARRPRRPIMPPPPPPSLPLPDEIPPLRFDGTLKTVEDYMATAHAKYLNNMLAVSSSEKSSRNPLTSAKFEDDADEGPAPFEDSQEKTRFAMPKDPCLYGTPEFLCTVQLVPGGMRYVVAREQVEEDLQEADESYRGFALPFCCGGRASRMILD